MSHYRLIFDYHIYQDSAEELRHSITTTLERADRESLTLIFSSEGGNPDEALALYNFLRALPIELHIHGVGHIGGVAVPVFLAGQKRTCSPFSRFFFHAYQGRFGARQTKDRIAEEAQSVNSDLDFSRKIVEARAKVPREVLDRLYEPDTMSTILDAGQAKKWGIVHDVLQLNGQNSPQPNVAVRRVGS